MFGMFQKSTSFYDKAIEFLVSYSPKVIGALTLFIVGLWSIRIISKIFHKQLDKRNVDETLKPFLRNLLKNVLLVVLIISVAGILGIETTSFVAVLGAAGLAIGLALQGSLANFAGGVLILIFRPIKVGHYIKAQGYEGTVEEILLFVTILKTLDNKVIYLPNGPLANGAIENLSQEDTRRVDMTFGISYNDDIDQARAAIKGALSTVENILPTPQPDIVVTELGDNSVNFSVRPWCKTEHYWQVFADTHETIKKLFDSKGISIPYPQRDVHIHQTVQE